NNTLTLSSSPPSVSLLLPESQSSLSHRRLSLSLTIDFRRLSHHLVSASLSPSSSVDFLSPSTSGDEIDSKSPRYQLLYETSSADPLCLRRDSTRAPTITEVLEVEKKNNGVVTTMFGFSEEFKHLVNPTHPDDKDFDSVVQLVQQGYKVKKSDWEQGFVDVFLQQKTLVDKAGQKTKMYSKTSKEQTQDEEEQQVEVGAEFGDGDKERETSKTNEGQTLEEGEKEQMEADTEVEEPVQEQKHKKNKEKRKDEAYEKAKEKFQDEDGSKLDKLIQMLYDLNKRVEVIENVLRLAPDGYESPCNYDDTKGAPNDENEKEENSGGKRNATDDENDEEEISDTQQLTEVNIFRENENTEKITLDEDTEKRSM
ncbi:hypothetical protein IGI04_001676, partial [Brassica rapa subsp. trilocularis]